MNGLYPCRYTHKNKRKSILATQFEAHHAREVLPCIDEPDAKATFDVTITSDEVDTVLSNMPEKSNKITEGRRTVAFERTPIMSTYLLAFVAGEMHFAEAESKGGVVIKSWGSIAQPKSHLAYSAKEGAAILDFFTSYFGVEFPLPKCDQIALPDFDAGAMENWGLITYREIALLVDPKNRSLSSEQYVSMVIAHELSHQWFGNLVTMKWWDDLWLNESFASLMEHIALDNLHPEWYQWEQYTMSDVILASNRDVFKDVQPVRTEVRHPDEVSSLFDPAIVYTKGARLLKMLMDYIGEHNFKKGLTDYFKKHAYQNTTRDDLWSALHQSSGHQIKALMDPWLEQSGLPIIKVVKTSTKTYKVSQKRFVLDSEGDNSIWPVPLLANQESSPEILHNSEHQIVIKSQKPLLININASSHYITKYTDPDTNKYLSDALQTKSVSPQLRINTLNDLLLLSRGGQARLVDALQLVQNCSNEDRDAVWMMIARVLSQSAAMIEGNQSAEQTIYEIRKNLAKNLYDQLGWDEQDSEDTNTRLLRHTIIGIMLAGRDKNAIQYALDVYDSKKNCQDLPAEYRAMILVALVRHGKPNIDKLLDEYKSSPNPEVQLAITAGLTEATKTIDIKKITSATIVPGGIVRTQDIFRWFVYLMRNPKSRTATWQWLEQNWDRLEKDMGPKMLDDLPGYAASALNTSAWQKKYRKFFEPKIKNPLLSRNIKIAMSEIEAKVAWRQREEPFLLDYLDG